MPALPIPTDQIVITASLTPQRGDQTAASVSIIDQERISHLGEPLIPALLRLVPSAAVTSIGPVGSLTEVRLRGSEANHSLLFVDGIKINDPASGDAPRFELLNADLASRIEVVRGPQSALWGSDAIGGVIAVNGLTEKPGGSLFAEAGSFGTFRASASAAARSSRADFSAALGWQRSTGIDSFGAPGGDRDGYHNLSGRARVGVTLSPTLRLNAAFLALSGTSEFDGYRQDFPFDHNDTLDRSRNHLVAGRSWVEAGNDTSDWRAVVGATLLESSNRNELGKDPVNRTRGTRRTLDVKIERAITIGTVENRLILAGESERETFRARDVVYGGFTNQDQARAHDAVTLEWRATGAKINADVAVRRDLFSRFADATSLRAALLGKLGGGFSLAGTYAEGIAQPTFFDLYGFFPGNFVGNPSLKPEHSRGGDISLRYARGGFSVALTGYRQILHDEIVDIGDPVTFLQTTRNRAELSRRSGVEAEASLKLSEGLRLSATYAFLKATEPGSIAGVVETERRRPRHSGSFIADGASGHWSYGASLAYVGSRLDTRDNYPFDIVRLGSYWLAGARLAYAVSNGIELYARASNLLNAHYEDSVGYRTEGRGLYAGIRWSHR